MTGSKLEDLELEILIYLVPMIGLEPTRSLHSGRF